MITSTDRTAGDYVKTHGRGVADVMTRDVLSVAETASVADIALLLETNRIKRVPVLRAGKLVGIVSRANLVRALAMTIEAAIGSNEVDDHSIRAKILAELKLQNWAEVASPKRDREKWYCPPLVLVRICAGEESASNRGSKLFWSATHGRSHEACSLRRTLKFHLADSVGCIDERINAFLNGPIDIEWRYLWPEAPDKFATAECIVTGAVTGKAEGRSESARHPVPPASSIGSAAHRVD